MICSSVRVGQVPMLSTIRLALAADVCIVLSSIGGTGWQTTSHDSVSAHDKPFNKFAGASGATFDSQGNATTGSQIDYRK